MKLYFEKIFIMYMILGGLITSIFPIPEIYKTIIAVPSLVIIPYLSGSFLSLEINSIRDNFDYISKVILRFIIGLIFIWILIMVFQFFGLYFLVKNFIYLLLIFYLILLLIIEIKQNKCKKYISESIYLFRIIKKNIYILLSIVSICILTGIMAKIALPFPLVGWNWVDPVAIFQPVERAMETGFLFDRRSISLVLYFLPCKLFNVSPIALSWVGSIFNTIIYGIGLFLFSYTLFKNKVISLFTLLFGLFILAYNGQPFNNFFTIIPSYDLYPSAILFSFCPLCIYLIYNSLIKNNAIKNTNYFHIIGISIVFVILFIIMFIIGNISKLSPITMYDQEKLIVSFSIVLIFVFYFIFKYKKTMVDNFIFTIFTIGIFYFAFHQEEFIIWTFIFIAFANLVFLIIINKDYFFKYLLYLFFISIFLFIIVQVTGLIKIETYNMLSSLVLGSNYSDIVFDFSSKYNSFIYAHPFPILELFLLGNILMIGNIKDKFYHKKLMIVAMSTLIILIFFFPDSWTIRINRQLAPFMALILSFSLYEIIKFVSKSHNCRNKNKYLRIIILFFLLLIVITPLSNPYVERFSYPIDKNTMIHSPITTYELDSIKWIQTNYRENITVISDPFTMFVFNGLLNNIHLVKPAMSDRPLDDKDTNKLIMIKEILNDPSKIQNIRTLSLSNLDYERDLLYKERILSPKQDIKYLLVISSRSIAWGKIEKLGPVTMPQYQNIDISLVEKFGDLVYIDDNICIIDITKEVNGNKND